MASILFLVLWTWAALFCSTGAISTISQTGAKFFTSDGQQFFIKGVAYQLVEDDPLMNPQQCKLDAAAMSQLGVNTIRVYHVNSAGDHDGCMNTFADAGIYVMVDLDSFKTYISYDGTPAWTQNKSASYRAVMDNFQQYDNTMAFFIGNEVLNTLTDSGAAPYLLSAASDMKSYSAARKYRTIPIGYSATDTAVLRPMLQDYLVCRPNDTERLDFFSLNSYEWCGADATYQTSGYETLQSLAEGYPVPIFFSEDGCNTVPPRTFNDQAAIFGPEMVGTWSGAIIYEWIQEMNGYGLVSYGAQQAPSVNEGSSVVQGFVRQGTPTPVQPDFSNLQAAWASATPTGVVSAQYTANMNLSTPSCPAASGGWTVDPSAALPTLGAAGVSPVTTTKSSSSASSTSEASSSATSQGAAGKTSSNPFSGTDAGFVGMICALIAVGAGVVILL